MRRLLLRLRRRTRIVALWLAFSAGMRLRRAPRGGVLLVSKTADEENILVLALELSRGLPHPQPIRMLSPDVLATTRCLDVLAPTLGGRRDRIEVEDLTTGRLLRRMLSAELAFTSHKLLPGTPTVGRRIHVHVTHGIGPKATSEFRSSERNLTTNTTVWTDQILRYLCMRADTVILPGLPRHDVIAAQTDVSAALDALGVGGDQPMVVWVPTYRETWSYGIGLVTEGRPIVGAAAERGRLDAEELRRLATSAGVRLVVKPHPLDAENFSTLGVPVLTNEQIWSAGCSPYQLLAAADGVISDYSSVWVDLLARTPSIALYCPDLAEFQKARGLSEPPLADLAEGLLLRSKADAEEFFAAVAERKPWAGEARGRCEERLGFRPAGSAAVLQRLAEDAEACWPSHDFGLASWRSARPSSVHR